MLLEALDPTVEIFRSDFQVNWDEEYDTGAVCEDLATPLFYITRMDDIAVYTGEPPRSSVIQRTKARYLKE